MLSAATDATAVAGTYNIDVTSLAAAQSLVSKQVADKTAAIGGGTITVDFGADLATGGTPTSTKTVTIGSDTSLEGIRDSINKANIGVTASIINDGSGTPYHIVLTVQQDRHAVRHAYQRQRQRRERHRGFRPGRGRAAERHVEKVAAANATLKINGIDVTSQSNTVQDAAQGVTLTLKSRASTTMNVTRDDASIKAAVQGFVTAYNNILSAVGSLTSFDTDAGTAGALNGDGTLRNIATRLRSMLTTPMSDGNGGSVTLSDLGIEFNVTTGNAGKLEIDDDKFNKALSDNFQDLTKFFSGVDGSAGMGKTITDYVDSLNGTSGALTAATDGITATLKDLEDKYTATQDRVTSTMDRYRAQFTQLDLLVSKLNQTSSYLTQQFAAMNGTSSK